MRIDHYGEVLVGCVYCNRWGRPGDERLIMEMLEDDLEAPATHLPGAAHRERLPWPGSMSPLTSRAENAK